MEDVIELMRKTENYPDEYYPDCHGGVRAVWRFPNGYAASVVCHIGSYGYEEGACELAVLHGGELCYETEITADVIGWIRSTEELSGLLLRIRQLAVNDECSHNGRQRYDKFVKPLEKLLKGE